VASFMYLPSFFLKITSLSVACEFEYGICKILFECCGGDHDISDHRGYDYYVLKHTAALYQQSHLAASRKSGQKE
jgi:hypothetical protein